MNASAGRIGSDPRFAALVATRLRFAVALSAGVLAAYCAFMLAVAFRPSLLALPLLDGGVTPVGVPLGAAVIVGSWLLTGLYVHRANTEFDGRTAELIREAGR